MERVDLCEGWHFCRKDRERTDIVRLPHDFSIGTVRTPSSPMGVEGGWFQGGRSAYERTLCLPPARRAILVIEGSMGVTQVFLNGEPLARHAYGYTEFHVDLSGRLTGNDKLTILVDNTVLPVSRWYTGSGLYRPVWAALGGEISIPLWTAHVTTPEIFPERAVIEVSFAVESVKSTENCPLSIALRAPGGSLAARLAWTQPLPQGVTQITRRITLEDPILWGPDEPALYTAELTAAEDSESICFGIRQVAISPSEGLRLNGASLKLRGGCIHHDNGPLGACTFPEAEYRKIARLKASGFNAVRCAHNPPSTALLDACDRLGMLVLDEAFDCWQTGKTQGDFHRWFADCWQKELAAMILRDRNHPSVILYSIGNEIPERCEPAGARLARQLTDEAHRLDPSRPVCCGVNGIFVEGGPYQGLLSNLLNGEGLDPASVPPEVRDILRRAGEQPQDWGALTQDFIAPLDVAGYNYLDCRYPSDRERYPERVICGTESFPKLMDTVWSRTLQSPNLIGDFTWAAWDYLGESGIGRASYGHPAGMFAEYPYHLATCGDYDICGRLRPQGAMRRIQWEAERRPALFVLPPDRFAQQETVSAWGWPAVEESWSFPGQEGRPVRVEVYSNAEEVELWRNDEILARAPVAGHRAEFTVVYRPGALRAVNLRGGLPAETAVLETAGVPDTLALIPEASSPIAVGGIAYLWAEVRDAAGQIVPWADGEITCSVLGPARVVACGAANPESRHCYTGSVCRAYHGRVLFVLRSENAHGVISVMVSCPGLKGAKAEMSVQEGNA